MTKKMPKWLKLLINKRIPITHHLTVTRKCNLRCYYCYPYYCEGWQEPSWHEIKREIDRMAQEKALILALTGGEPMVRKDFFRIVNYAESKSFAITLNTNGTLITPRIADKIARLKFWEVKIGLLAADSKTHDAITALRGSFKRSVTAIKLLKRRGVRVSIQSALQRGNGKLAQQMRSLARRLKVKVKIAPIITEAEVLREQKRVGNKWQAISSQESKEGLKYASC